MIRYFLLRNSGAQPHALARVDDGAAEQVLPGEAAWSGAPNLYNLAFDVDPTWVEVDRVGAAAVLAEFGAPADLLVRPLS